MSDQSDQTKPDETVPADPPKPDAGSFTEAIEHPFVEDISEVEAEQSTVNTVIDEGTEDADGNVTGRVVYDPVNVVAYPEQEPVTP